MVFKQDGSSVNLIRLELKSYFLKDRVYFYANINPDILH